MGALQKPQKCAVANITFGEDAPETRHAALGYTCDPA
jgi:hypothetical protein